MLRAKNMKLLWLLLGLCIISPFVYLGWLGTPSSDDYYDFKLLKQLGYFHAISHYYLNWSGRFISYALAFLLNPLHLGESIGPAIYNTLSITMLFSMAYFQAKIYSLIYKVENSVLPITIIIASFWIMYLPRPVEMLFWFTGSIAYLVGPFLITVWVWIHIQKTKNSIWRKWVYFLFPFIIAGGSEINVLLMACVMSLCFPLTRDAQKIYLIPLFSFLLGACIELLSPGSQNRMEYFESVNPAGNIQISSIQSLEFSWHVIRDWTRSSPLLFVAFIISLFLGNRKKLTLNLWQKIWLFCSLAIIPILYFPFFWATGMLQPPDRLNDYIFLVFSTIVVFVLPILLGKLLNNTRIPSQILFIAFLFIAWRGSYTSRLRTAIFDLDTLPKYVSELQHRNNLVESFRQTNSPSDTLFIPEIKHIPYTIFYGDLKSDPTHWYNEGYAYYHGISAVICLPEEQ